MLTDVRSPVSAEHSGKEILNKTEDNKHEETTVWHYGTDTPVIHNTYY